MGEIFKVSAFIIYFVAGLWGFLLCLGIVFNQLGFIWGIIAFFLAPVTIVVAPWYEALTHSNWFPVVLIYGGGIGASILYYIGSLFDGDN